MATIKLYELNDNGRALFQLMIREPIPETASHIAVDEKGYQFITREEFRTACGRQFVFPEMEILNSYELEYEE